MMSDLLCKVKKRDETLCLSHLRWNGFPTQNSCDRKNILDIVAGDFYRNYSMLEFLFSVAFVSVEERVDDELS